MATALASKNDNRRLRMGFSSFCFQVSLSSPERRIPDWARRAQTGASRVPSRAHERICGVKPPKLKMKSRAAGDPGGAPGGPVRGKGIPRARKSFSVGQSVGREGQLASPRRAALVSRESGATAGSQPI
jgi:hypothetical protein